jgi:hypothetical protein
MMYLNTIETNSNCNAGLLGPVFPDEDHRRRLFGNMLGLMARGLAAAFLFPVEALDRLRTGRVPQRSAWTRWIASAVILASGIALWVLSRATFLDGKDRTSAILGYLLTLCTASFVNGRLLMRSESLVPALAAAGEDAPFLEHRGHGHNGHRDSEHHGHGNPGGGHHGRGRHGHQPRWQGESAGLTIPPQSAGSKVSAPAQTAGVCTGRCRECPEEICLKSGKPKPRRTA